MARLSGDIVPSTLLELLHSTVPGRARFRVRGLYRTPAVAAHLEQRLGREAAVRQRQANPLTGTLLVAFDPGLPLAQLRDWILEALHERFQPGPPTAEASAPPRLRGGRRSRENAELRAIRRLAGQAAEQPTGAWHTWEAAALIRHFGTVPGAGLSDAAAAERLQRYGPNLLAEAVPRSALAMLLAQFRSLPVLLLAGSAGLSAVTGGLVDAGAIVVVLLANALIGFLTERQAERIISTLTRTVLQPNAVRRDGRRVERRPEEIVPGDLVELQPGSYVPGDGRVVEAAQLSIDESSLTGESLPVAKTSAALAEARVPLSDRRNMGYMGTTVTGGSGLLLVTATGDYTEIGRIQSLIGEAQAPETPMQKQLAHLGNRLVLLSGAICAAVFATGLVRGLGLLPMLKAAVSLAVAAVPEGLPTVATTTLALGISDMRKHRVLVRKLSAVETLGSVQVICLDKTGTLTCNRMSVVEVGTGGDGAVDVRQLEPSRNLRWLLQIAALCNESTLEGPPGAPTLRGSATENALLALALDGGIDVPGLRAKRPVLAVNYRSQSRLFMSTLHRGAAGRQLLAVKGNPPEVLALCGSYLRDGRRCPLGDDTRQDILAANEGMAGRALRVLGFAYGFTREESWNADDGQALVWLGLAGMADPLRDGAVEVIRRFHEAGVETVMITGDQSATAKAIGTRLDLSGSGPPLSILDSAALDRLEPDVLAGLTRRTHAFARVSPAQKLQIVQALQRAGRVVAMTGDGINDGPALKCADVGVAMGRGGTDVARSVADVVLEEDELETMLTAIGHGRTIYANIRKAVHYLLSTNLSEIELMFFSIAAGLGQPLTPLQLLWLNLATDVAPALALAVEAPEPGVLNQPPRDPGEPIVGRADLRRAARESLLLTAGAAAALGYGRLRYGLGPQASTLAFTTLSLAQIAHAWTCRSAVRDWPGAGDLPRNRTLELTLAGTGAAQLACPLLPPLRGLLQLAPLGLVDLAVVAGGVALPLIVNQLAKPAPRRPPHSPG